MKITPRSDEEISELGVLPEGTYDFEVIHAQEERSKRSGNEMLHIVLRVFPDSGGVPVRVHDYLLDLPYKGMAAKLRHFCQATAMEEQYADGNLLAQDLNGRTGRCQIGIQKDRNGEYEDKNVVEDYLPGQEAALAEGNLSEPGRSAPAEPTPKTNIYVPFD